MRYRLISAVVLTAVLVSAVCVADEVDPRVMERARRLHERAIVIDTHVDTPMRMSRGELDIGKRNDRGQVDLPRMIEGGLDAIFLAVFISNELDDQHPSGKTLETIDVIYRQVNKYPGWKCNE